MTRDEFAALVGGAVVHCTYAGNVAPIGALGLMPPVLLADLAGLDPAALVLRRRAPGMRVRGWPVRLNDQRQLLKGRNQAFLDGHSLASWSAELDRRIFFLPGAPQAETTPFFRSLGPDARAIRLDAAAFFDAFAPDIWLSPINSGNADRRPSRRGDWLYVPVRDSVDAFRLNRVRRGLVASPDRVAEISIRQPVPPALLIRLILR